MGKTRKGFGLCLKEDIVRLKKKEEEGVMLYIENMRLKMLAPSSRH